MLQRYPREGEMLRRLLIGGASVMLGLVAGLLLIEGAVRTFGLFRFPNETFVQPHPELGWSHIPNKEGYWHIGEDRVFVRINSKGLRDRELSYEKRPNTFRILVLGDSFVEGMQVPLEETFAKRLESKLNESGMTFEVINAGFAGVGTDYGLLFLRKEGYKYHPDLVLLGFFAGNDVQDNFRSREILRHGQTGLAYEKRGIMVTLRQFLAAHSCAYNYLGLALPTWTPQFGKILMNLGLLSAQPAGDPGTEAARPWLVFAKSYPADLKEAWAVTHFLMSALAEEAEVHGSELAVFSIPSREQVYSHLWEGLISRPTFKQIEWDLEKPDRILLGLTHECGIPFFSLLPAFREKAKTDRLYYGEDGHWNSKGNQLAAELVFDWLVQEALVPWPTELLKDDPRKAPCKGAATRSLLHNLGKSETRLCKGLTKGQSSIQESLVGAITAFER